jgi:hypothetical protein
MKYLFYIFLCLYGSSYASTKDIKLEVWPMGEAYFELIVTNNSKDDITVPRTINHIEVPSSYREDENGNTTHMYIDIIINAFETSLVGYTLVGSIHDFKPVTLKNGESTIMKLDEWLFEGFKEDVLSENLPIIARYSVESKTADRYKFSNIKLESGSVKVEKGVFVTK